MITLRQTNTPARLARVRSVPNTLKRQGLEEDEEFVEAFYDLREFAEMYRQDMEVQGRESPTLYSLPRLVSNQDSDGFKRQTADLSYREWPEVDVVEGVVIATNNFRQMRQYREYDTSRPNPIVCASPDTRHGVGVPGGECRNCEFQDWDIAKGKGLKRPECDDRLRLFILTLEYAQPFIIDLNGAHKRHWNNYVNELRNMASDPWMIVSKLELQIVGNRGALVGEAKGYIDTSNEELVEVINAMQESIQLMCLEESLYTIYGDRVFSEPWNELIEEDVEYVRVSNAPRADADGVIVEERPRPAPPRPEPRPRPELEMDGAIEDRIADEADREPMPGERRIQPDTPVGNSLRDIIRKRRS